ncbi:hypothetical protein [Mycolicibacterium madagascariense]|uniref:hypothetical protein n=1 Tax=Mycolicibacterium madagascariense TaxID=212765 RepID=UPI0013D687BF|nr:hypothetical protein [Mycolicibacterium madagascariense]MCV7013061.1 hypothetical protein [Mycolicibacterium madagascariense]
MAGDFPASSSSAMCWSTSTEIFVSSDTSPDTPRRPPILRGLDEHVLGSTPVVVILTR